MHTCKYLVCMVISASFFSIACMQQQPRSHFKNLQERAFAAIDKDDLLSYMETHEHIRDMVNNSPVFTATIRSYFLSDYVPLVLQHPLYEKKLNTDKPKVLTVHAPESHCVMAHSFSLLYEPPYYRHKTVIHPKFFGRKPVALIINEKNEYICAFTRQDDTKRFDYVVFDKNLEAHIVFRNKPSCPTVFSPFHNKNLTLLMSMLDEVEQAFDYKECLCFNIDTIHHQALIVSKRCLTTFDLLSQKEHSKLHSFDTVCSILLSPCADIVVIGQKNKGPTLYSMKKNEIYSLENAHECAEQRSLFINGSGSLVAHLDALGILRIWDVSSLHKIAEIPEVRVMTLDPFQERLLYVPQGIIFKQNLLIFSLSLLKKHYSASEYLLLLACLKARKELWQTYPNLSNRLDDFTKQNIAILLEKNTDHCIIS